MVRVPAANRLQGSTGRAGSRRHTVPPRTRRSKNQNGNEGTEGGAGTGGLLQRRPASDATSHVSEVDWRKPRAWAGDGPVSDRSRSPHRPAGRRMSARTLVAALGRQRTCASVAQMPGRDVWHPATAAGIGRQRVIQRQHVVIATRAIRAARFALRAQLRQQVQKHLEHAAEAPCRRGTTSMRASATWSMAPPP